MKTIFTLQMILFVLIFSFSGKSQQITFSGKVLDSRSGKPLSYASIFESNSKIGTITDNEGMFKLILSEGALSIQISENGFKVYTNQLVLKTDTTVTVNLEPEIQSGNRLKNDTVLQADAKTSKKESARRSFKKSRR